MPLYIDEITIIERLGPKVGETMLSVRKEMDGIGVTPSFALSLIKQHLRPLIPSRHHHVIDKEKTPDWDTIFGMYVEFLYQSQENAELGLVADAIYLIHRYTKNGTREFLFPDSVDVVHFMNTCRFLKVSVSDLRRDAEDNEFDLFHFCKYCWRLPPPRRQICAVHSDTHPHSTIPGDTVAESDSGNKSRYKEGRRQQALFESVLNRLLTAESLEFHESNFVAEITPPSTGIVKWLVQRRPHLWASLGGAAEGISDTNALSILLTALHSPIGLPFSTQQLYVKANERMMLNPILIGPMLARAEAWLMAREQRKKNWGGSRTRSNDRI